MELPTSNIKVPMPAVQPPLVDDEVSKAQRQVIDNAWYAIGFRNGAEKTADGILARVEALEKQKEAIIIRQRQILRLKRLLRTALADLTGVHAGRLTPEQLQIFLSDCADALGPDD